LSGQAHIFLHENRFVKTDQRDARELREIKEEGILPEFNQLSNIGQLSVTVLHEVSLIQVSSHPRIALNRISV